HSALKVYQFVNIGMLINVVAPAGARYGESERLDQGDEIAEADVLRAGQCFFEQLSFVHNCSRIRRMIPRRDSCVIPGAGEPEASATGARFTLACASGSIPLLEPAAPARVIHLPTHPLTLRISAATIS